MRPVSFPRRRSLGALALLCFAVLIFSYLLSLTIALACLAMPALLFSHLTVDAISLLLAYVALFIGATIIWSIFPRRAECKLLGVEIDLSSQPRLKQLIEDIAARIGQRMPDTVYLIPDANAFVTERGRRRIMGLGLPLIAAMSTAEFSGVLAHEFAHYYSGDTRLGPRVYQTRTAMARTIQNVGAANSAASSLARIPVAGILYVLVVFALVGYWNLFLRFTKVVSHQQEYRSDELACFIAGPAAMAEGLRMVTMIGAAAPLFWRGAINPVLNAGHLPPLADGFRRYLAAPGPFLNASCALLKARKNPPSNPYDTHPPLKLRLERIGRVQANEETQPDPSRALALLDDPSTLERRLLALMAPGVDVAALRPMDWDSAAQTVWLPLWRKTVAEHGKLLGNQTIGALPELVPTLPQIGARIPDPPGRLLTREHRTQRASDLVWMALSIRMHEHGWDIHAHPAWLFLQKDKERITPRERIAALQQGKTSAQEWAAWCARSGLAEVRLNPFE